MRLSVELSDEMFRQLMLKADEEGLPVHEIMLRGIERELELITSNLKRFEVPVIRSSRPGTLNLTNKQIEDTLLLEIREPFKET